MSDEMLKLAGKVDRVARMMRKIIADVPFHDQDAADLEAGAKALRAAAASAKSVSCNEKVSIDRSWLEHVVLVLQGELPSGRIGDVVFLLRDQLRDILDRPCPAPDAMPHYPNDLCSQAKREIASIRAQLDKACAMQRDSSARQNAAVSRAEAAEAQLASARRALEPFAAVAEQDIGADEVDSDIFMPMREPHNRAPRLRVGHLRAAKAALTDEQRGEK